MSSNNYTIRPMEKSDIPETGELLYKSKLSLTINRLLFKNWPNEAIQRKNYASIFKDLGTAGSAPLSVVDNASGEVVGHLAINRRRPARKAEQDSSAGNDKAKATAPPQIPDYFNPEVLSAVETASSDLKRLMEKTDHIELTYIIVKPEHRGRGIGRRLMDYVFLEAKSLGLAVSLATEPQVYDFFIKQGFKDTGYVDFDLAKWAPLYSGFGTFRLAGMVWYPEV